MTDANETAKEEAIKIPDVLPVLPLKDLVIFPFIIVPLSVSREKSINAVDQALAENRVIMLTAQKDFQNEDPGEEDLYRTGQSPWAVWQDRSSHVGGRVRAVDVPDLNGSAE